MKSTTSLLRFAYSLSSFASHPILAVLGTVCAFFPPIRNAVLSARSSLPVFYHERAFPAKATPYHHFFQLQCTAKPGVLLKACRTRPQHEPTRTSKNSHHASVSSLTSRPLSFTSLHLSSLTNPSPAQTHHPSISAPDPFLIYSGTAELCFFIAPAAKCFTSVFACTSSFFIAPCE